MLKSIKEWVLIFVGCTIMAAGFVFFINPYKIVPGGVYGASIVVHNIFPSLQVGTIGYFFDVPLLLLSMWLLGAKLGIRTLAAALSTPAIMNFITWLAFPNETALQMLDPAQIVGGNLDMSNDLMLASILGSTLIGIGEGLVIRQQATTGGTDIVAMIMQKYLHIKFSNSILIADGVVVGFGILVFSLGLNDTGEVSAPLLLSFYSLIAIFVTSRVLAVVINGIKDDKLIFIISKKPLQELHDYIIRDLDRSATVIKSSGLYSKEDNHMIFLVLPNKDIAKVKGKIKENDPRAFVVVTDAYDTFGEGWKPLPNFNELQAE